METNISQSSDFTSFPPEFEAMHHALRDCTGGQVPPPSTHANAPPGGVRRQGAAAGGALHPFRGRAAANSCQALVGLHNHLRGAQQARSAPRTNVRELFCGSKITRNDSDEAERRERSPSGVVSAANGEELTGAARQVRGASPAREWKCFASQREVRGEWTGDRARRRRAGLEKGPPEPSANDRHPVCDR